MWYNVIKRQLDNVGCSSSEPEACSLPKRGQHELVLLALASLSLTKWEGQDINWNRHDLPILSSGSTDHGPGTYQLLITRHVAHP